MTIKYLEVGEDVQYFPQGAPVCGGLDTRGPFHAVVTGIPDAERCVVDLIYWDDKLDQKVARGIPIYLRNGPEDASQPYCVSIEE